MRIAVDMDEVIADALPAQLAWIEDRFGYALSHEALAGRKMIEAIAPDHYEMLQAHLHEGIFFGSLGPVTGAQEALELLNERHEIFITTAAMEYPKSLPFKFDWLSRHFPFLDPLRFVFCGDKSILSADVLIDDNARHFERFRGQGILFSAPHNAGEGRYPRVGNWQEALVYLNTFHHA